MNRAVQKTRSTVYFLRRFGVLGFLEELRYRLTDHYYERRLGVETAGRLTATDLGFANAEFMDYDPIWYWEIYSALNRIPLNQSTSTFLDYGSGKGRAVIAAAALPFRRVIGIEISDRLLAIAKKNLDTMRHKRCKRVELLLTDATQYAVPEDVNLIYFFNPFAGQVLQAVIGNIYASYKQSPREMYIVFFNNHHFENAIKNQHWLTRIEQRSFHHYDYNHSCGIYVTKASFSQKARRLDPASAEGCERVTDRLQDKKLSY
ncbi:MAG TPA: class I SAM-dependent methyltransferase [Candidatus Binatia bacterium]|jgi:SAM-dependent methyltransferase|nr:class I SAM-dependent methyltransferase [Candidatus Binatia bacterium]